MTKKQADRILWWIYRQLKTGSIPIYLQRLKGRTDGIFDPNNWWIVVDPSSCICRTLIHEFLHMKIPDASESKICCLTRQVMSHVSNTQYHHLLSRLVSSAVNIPYHVDSKLLSHGEAAYLKGVKRCIINEAYIG